MNNDNKGSNKAKFSCSTSCLALLILLMLSTCGEPDIVDGVVYQLTDYKSWEEKLKINENLSKNEIREIAKADAFRYIIENESSVLYNMIEVFCSEKEISISECQNDENFPQKFWEWFSADFEKGWRNDE